MEVLGLRNGLSKISAIIFALVICGAGACVPVHAQEGNEAYGTTTWEDGEYFYTISNYKAGTQKSADGNRILSASGEMRPAGNNVGYWGDLTKESYAKGKEEWVELFRGYVPADTVIRMHMQIHSCIHKKNTYAGIRIARRPEDAPDTFRSVSVKGSGAHPMWSVDGWKSFSEASKELTGVSAMDFRVLGNDRDKISDLSADLTYECTEEGEYVFEVYGYVQHCSYGANTLEVGGVGEMGVVPVLPDPIGEVGEYRVVKGAAGVGTSMSMLGFDGNYIPVCSVAGGNGGAPVNLCGDHVCKVLESSSFEGRAPSGDYYTEAKGGGSTYIPEGNGTVESRTPSGNVFGRILLIGEPQYTPSEKGGEQSTPGAEITPIPAIRFHAGGGIGEMADEVFGNGFEGAYLTPCAFSAAGKRFAGWGIVKDGKEIVLAEQYPISEEEFLHFYEMQKGKKYNGGMLELFAVWK